MHPGDVLADRFRIDRPAGEGAMGAVFRGHDLARDQPVAIKTFRADAAPPRNAGAVPLVHGVIPSVRFMREAETLAALQAEGVVRYVHHGEDRDGQPFLVMEWIEGPTLAQALRERGLTPFAALQLGQRLASALAATHRAGIVHRDLKPGNIMLPGGELAQARIVDFGIARIAGTGAEITTQHGQLGTPRYMAPEQIRDPRAVDGRADVFALGCVLFECLTGTPAFGGEDPVTVLAQVLFQHANEPSALRPELPEWLDRTIGRLLAKQREQRPDAHALAVELAAVLASAAAIELAALPAAPARVPSIAAPSQPGAAGVTMSATRDAQLEPPPLRPSVELWPARVHSLRARLPDSAGVLIGRDAELAALSPQLERGAPIALWGSAGMGKTRLALELAQRALAERATPIDAVLFVELSAAHSTADAVRMVAEQAQLLPGASDQPEALVGALLAKLGRVLLVLDRVEQLAGQIEPLIKLWTAAAPRLQLIVTSRIRLRLPQAFELHPLASTVPDLAPGSHALSPAASLVLARTRALLPDLPDAGQLDARTADALERIARALDGIPRAIELAAARVAVLGLDGVLERLSAPLQLLGGRPSEPHATTMRGAIAWSWAGLSEPERQVCMQCAVFRDGFEPAAAQAVVALANGAPPLPELLRSLREQSLLVSRTARGDARQLRLSLFAAVREFALEQWTLHAPNDALLAAAPSRHAHYFAARARELLAAPVALDDERAGLAPLRARERENLVAALEHALAAQPPELAAAFTMLRALEPVLLARGLAGELASLLQRALSLAATAVPADLQLAEQLAAARQLHARLLLPAGQLERARAELASALASAQQLELSALQAGIWLDLGVAHHFARELEAARSCYQTALALLQEHDDVINEARCVGNLAAIAHDRGELQAALSGYRRAIALLEATQEPRLLANFCGNLALCEHELAQTEAARASYQRALALLEPLGDARLLGIVLSNFGTLELAQGRLGDALALQERACVLLQDAGDPRSDGLARGRRAVALSLLDRLPEAERQSANAERMLRRDPLGSAVLALLHAFIELGHARLATRSGSFEQAQAELDASAQRAERAQHAELHDTRLYDQCDDVRLYLSVLEPALARERAVLEQARRAQGSGAA